MTGPGGVWGGNPLFLDQTEARRVEKNIFWHRPSYLRVWMTAIPPNPPPPLSEGLDRPRRVIGVLLWYRTLQEICKKWVQRVTLLQLLHFLTQNQCLIVVGSLECWTMVPGLNVLSNSFPLISEFGSFIGSSGRLFDSFWTRVFINRCYTAKPNKILKETTP